MRSSTNRLFPRAAVPPSLGAAVRTARIALGWTQRDLARKVGASPRSIMRMEALGERPRGDGDERGLRHRPSSHLIHAVERTLDTGPLVPGWAEPSDPNAPSYGPRVRAARRAAKLSLAAAADAAGVSVSTLSRFERELGDAPSLAGRWDTANEGIFNHGLAVVLGFDGVATLNAWCRDHGGVRPPGG